jgi:ATP-binding cassette, subfamily A (ABC1), member 3
MALTSASVFAAVFFTGPQIASICCTVGFLVVGLIGLIVGKDSPPTGVVTILSLLFPSMNYMFMMGYMCRYEEQGLPTNLLRAPKSTSEEPSASLTPGVAIWALLVLHILIYPILATYTERAINRTTYSRRTTGGHTGRDSAVKATNLTKIYRPKFYQRWFTGTKAKDIVAVTDLTLTARRGQISCLLGANGSGKTTTLEMIAGFRHPTRGSIHIDAGRGQLGELQILTCCRQYEFH